MFIDPFALPRKPEKKPRFSEIKRMTDFSNTSYFTSMHQNRETLFESQFNVNSAFTEKMIMLNTMKMALKVGLITVASAGFGLIMGFFMSSFEFNSTMQVDTNRSTTS